MAAFINTIDALGDEAVVDGIIDRTIVEFKDDKITGIASWAFYDCSKLSEVNLPNVTVMGLGVFTNCSSLKKVELPNLRGAMAYTNAQEWFFGCTSLETITLPSATELGMFRAFNNCTSLAYADFPVLTKIGNYDFAGCTALKALVLRRSSSVVTLNGAYNFGSTPIESGTGCIYVPANLVESYKTATNWSNYATQFRALEDWTIDGTITGELATIYSITNSLIRVATSNPANGVKVNESYSTILTSTNVNPVEDVVVTMGGVDITTDAYNAETGEISIPAVTGDVVISAKADNIAGVLYELPEATTFNGTSDYIDTGIKLADENKEFTIKLSVTAGSPNSTANVTIFHSMHEAAPYYGYGLMGRNGKYMVVGDTKEQTTTIPVANSSFKMVMTHMAGTSGYYLAYMYDGTITTYNVTGTFGIAAQNLLLGAYQETSGTKGRFWNGTINDFVVLNYAALEDEITEYLND